MNILLTNDDGIFAEGINALYEVLSSKHNVYIIAPDEEKSGSSTAISFKDCIKATLITENKFSVAGYPADCVNLGLKGDLIPKPDLVVSGINHGPNLGDDIHFSGTVGGARVAFIYGISGIAISIDCRVRSKYFRDAAEFLAAYIEKSGFLIRDKCRFMNINYPDIATNEIIGVKYMSLGRRNYNDSYKVISNENGQLNLKYIPEIGIPDNNSCDISEVKKGYITITPLLIDCTDYEFLHSIKSCSTCVHK